MNGNDKIKILMIIRSLKFGGGTEKICVNLGNSLNSEGGKYSVSFFSFYKDEHVYNHKGEEFCLNKKSNNIVGKIFYSFIGAIKLLKICKKNHTDIMIAYMGSGILASLLSKIFGNKSKLYITIHRNLLDFPEWIVSLFSFFAKRYADKIIVLTETEKNNLTKNFGIDKKKISIIPNYIEKEQVSILSKEPIGTYKNLFNNKNFSFITIGRLEKIKNQELMIYAFKKLNKKCPNTQLIILGEGEEKENLKNISNNNVHFLGNQENVFKFLNNCNCFLLTSISESFSIAILEAMSCNLPIISTKTQGPNEILENERYGILIEHNKESLYNAMKKVLIDEYLRNHYKQMSQERVQNYQKDNIMKLWENIINE